MTKLAFKIGDRVWYSERFRGKQPFIETGMIVQCDGTLARVRLDAQRTPGATAMVRTISLGRLALRDGPSPTGSAGSQSTAPEITHNAQRTKEKTDE